MVEITREMMDKLFKKQSSSLMLVLVLGAVMCAVGFIVITAFEGSISAVAIAVLLLAIPFFMYKHIKKKLIPAGYGKTVSRALQTMQNGFMWDGMVNVLFDMIGKADSFADKTILTLLLCDVYQMRGQISESISLLDSIDRSRFIEYPTVGLSFYNTVTDTYTVIGDNESVLAAFADAEPFINECASRNYACCNTALSIIIHGERAKGNYRRALELKLMKNDFENQLNSVTGTQPQTTALSQFIRGSVFFETAELFYLCGDYDSAAKYLDIGGPMLTASKYTLERANRLSAMIREKMN